MERLWNARTIDKDVTGNCPCFQAQYSLVKCIRYALIHVTDYILLSDKDYFPEQSVPEVIVANIGVTEYLIF